MALTIGRANCTVCLRRPRDEGGNGQCPIQGYPHFAEYRALSVSGDGHECPKFKVGDSRRKGAPPLPAEQAAMF